jgi:hypothetical protein
MTTTMMMIAAVLICVMLMRGADAVRMDDETSSRLSSGDCANPNKNAFECFAVGKPLRAAPPAGYDTPEDLLAYFQSVARDYPELCELIDLNSAYGTPLGHEGGRIYSLKISDNVGEDEDEPNILFVGNHHARELITPQIARNTTEQFLALYLAGNAEVADIVENYQIYVMWTMNPDGLAYVWDVDDFWRKNRRNNGNSYGVDLNRNYPPGWSSSCGGSTSPSSDTYRGPSAGSEPETQTMMAFQKERNFAKILDWHSYARDTRPGYGDCGLRDARMTTLWNTVGIDLAETMQGYVLGESCCMGGDIHNGFDQQGSMAVLIETGTAFQPSESAMREELRRVWPGTLWFATLPIAISGHIRDQSGRPLKAFFDIAGINYSYDEPANWSSHPLHGRYHLWLPDGSFNVTVSAPGCSPSSRVLSSSLYQSNVYDFTLNC